MKRCLQEMPANERPQVLFFAPGQLQSAGLLGLINVLPQLKDLVIVK